MKKTRERANAPSPRPVHLTFESSKTDMQSLARPCAPAHLTCTESNPTHAVPRTPAGAGCAPHGPSHDGRSVGDGPGLVHSQTSDTPQPPPYGPGLNRIAIDKTKTRLKRLKCSVLTAARLHQQSRPKWKVAMITPTYAPEHSWTARDITQLTKHIRNWLARRGIDMRYVWVMEYTKKGKPHYHMLLWLPLGITLPKPDKRGWWHKGWTKIEWARNAVGYIAKYASKGSELVQYVPGARHHGSGGMEGEALLEQRWWKLPAWLRADTLMTECWKRRAGGGFVSSETGEARDSPWEVSFEHGQVFIQLKGAGA
jgi:hypothetical protein